MKRFNVDEFYDDEYVKTLSKTTLPDPELLDYYNRLSRREIFINCDITEELVEYSHQIIKWNIEDKDVPVESRKKIKIFINTDGGEATAANNFISVMQLSKTPCITIGMGKCYSAGALIFLAGKERYIFKNTIIMIHKGSSGIISDVNKIIDYSKFLEKDNEICKEFILQNSKIPVKKYKEVEDKDWYIFPTEAIDYGIATRIISDIDELI
jgi:ATP-dependent Clp protease protease subunit